MDHQIGSAGSTEDEGNIQKSKKRPRVSGIADLSDDLIGKAFKFLGHGHFLFVAGTLSGLRNDIYI